MPSFSMSELVQSVGKGATVAQSSHTNNQPGEDTTVGRRRKRASGDTIALIRKFIADQKRPVTLMEICDHLKRRPAPHLRAMLRELVTAGEIVQTYDFGAGPSIPRYWYSLP